MRPNLEFQHENHAAPYNDGIRASSHARNGKLKRKPTLCYASQLAFQQFDFRKPGHALAGIQLMGMTSREMAQNGLRAVA